MYTDCRLSVQERRIVFSMPRRMARNQFDIWKFMKDFIFVLNV